MKVHKIKVSQRESLPRKIEATCKQCGKTFVKYTYSTVSRCEHCREKNRAIAEECDSIAVQVLMVSLKGREMDHVIGLEIGADGYVTRSFSPRELMLRLRDMLGSSEPDADCDPRFSFWQDEGFQVDLNAHRVMVDGNEVILTAMEFKLLATLIRYRGAVLSRDQLLEKVWGYNYDGYARAVDVAVRRLRTKVSPYSHWVETVRGVGYRFRK